MLGKLVLLENAKFPIKTGQKDIQTFSSLCKKSWSSHSRNVQSQIYAAQKVAWPGRMRTRPTVGILRYRVNFCVWSDILRLFTAPIYANHDYLSGTNSSGHMTVLKTQIKHKFAIPSIDIINIVRIFINIHKKKNSQGILFSPIWDWGVCEWGVLCGGGGSVLDLSAETGAANG